MRKVLVTGGAGYIGSKIATDLLKKNYKVIVVDNLSTGYKKLVNKKCIFFRCDIGNKKKINFILKKYQINSVVHCAASLDIAESEKNPKKYLKNNFLNTKILLNACIKNKLKNFIFSSTCAVYGNVSGKITENCIPNPVSVYGKTKYECEKIIKKFSLKHKFNYGILRYFNVAGSDIKNNIGCINKNNQLIKNLSRSVANKTNEIFVYGNDYNTKDGTCIRDYIHLNDLSKVHCKLLFLVSKKNKSFVFNCGYGKGFSVLEIIKKFEQIYKIQIKKKYLQRRKGDIEKIFANTKKIDRILKLNLNKKNKLKKIIVSSVKWEKLLNEK